MPLKLFEFLEQFIIDTLLIKITQFEKIGSIGKIFISRGNSIIKFHFRKKKSITPFSVTFILSLFDSGVCFPYNKRNELSLKRNQVKPRKIKLSIKNHRNLY